MAINHIGVMSGIGGLITSTTLATQTGDKTITNTTVETSMFDGIVGSKKIAPNYLHPGKTIRVKLNGIYSCNNGVDATVKVKLGSVTLASSTSSLTQTTTDSLFELEFMFTCRTEGVAGTVIGQGRSIVYAGQGFSTATSRALKMMSPATVDTTIENEIDITYTWGTASPTNSIKTTNITIESYW